VASGKKTGTTKGPAAETSKDEAAKPSTARKTAPKTSANKPVIAETAGTTDKTADTPTSSASAAAKKSAAAKPAAKDETPVDKSAVKAAESSPAVTAQDTAEDKPSAPGNDSKTSETGKAAAPKDNRSAFQPTRDVISTTTGAGSTPPPPSPVTAEKKSGSIFLPLVLGGVVAAALGFAASEANLLGLRSQGGDLRSALEKQSAEIAALKDAAPPQVDLSGLEQEIAGLSENVQSFESRIAALEARPVASSGDGGGGDTSAYSADLAQMQAALEKQRSEIEGLLKNAQSIEEATAASARAAAVQAGVSKLTAAISTGSAYDGALDALKEAGVNDLPQALVDGAADGVVTLNNLQSRFPDAARSALAAARAGGFDAQDTGGVTGFLRRQLGARSVEPREGSDPDAVLSRAEAAVRDGRLSVALEEIGALPEEAQSAMSDWISDARRRAAVEAAVNDLSQSLTAN